MQVQAIMFLAGNGSSISSNMAQSNIQVQTPSSKPIATDVSPVNLSVTIPPCSRLSSPVSFSSQTGAQSGSGSTSTEEIMAAKKTGVATTPVSKLETPKISSAMGTVTATSMMPSGMNLYSGRQFCIICNLRKLPNFEAHPSSMKYILSTSIFSYYCIYHV